MIRCDHCEADATEDDDANDGDSFKCASCGVLGMVQVGDRDVSFGDYTEAVAYLYFGASEGERCTWDGCEECREPSRRGGDGG